MFKKNFLLTLILLLAFTVRLWQLDKNPAGFFCDEASIGYNAYSIFNTGKDEHGVSFPVFFRAFGEYKGPIQIYSTIPFIALLGLNEFSVRLTSVVFGILTVFAVWLLTQELFKNHKHKQTIALLSAFFLAISPWHIHFSRVAFEIIPFVFFTTLGLYFFLIARNKPEILILSALAFCLALYSYFPARLFIPLFGLGIFLVYFRFFKEYKKETTISFILLIMLLIPLLRAMFTPSGWARWQQVSIFSQPPKDVSVIKHIFNNYLSHFSLDFLFLKGDTGMSGQFITRHSVRGLGELYLFQLPLILAGFFYLFKARQKRAFGLLVFWLILYPLGSAFTLDKSAQATRSIIGVIPFQILSALGLVYLIKLIKNSLFQRILIASTALIIIVSFQNYLQKYFIEYPTYSSDFWGWQYGPRDTMGYFLAAKDNYDDLYLSGEFNAPEIFLKFYDPKNSCQNKCKIGDFWRNPSIYNFQRRQLFSLSPEYLKNSGREKQFITKQTLYYPNGQIAFLIGEIKK